MAAKAQVPHDGEEAVESSLAYLRQNLALDISVVESHTVIAVQGCDRPDSILHLGRFLVGAIAQAIRTDLSLQPLLISPGYEGQEELGRDVSKVIGTEGAALTDHERTHGRDPWIGEAIGHLMLVLSDRSPHPGVPAPMVAAHLPHVEPREHGLDLFGFCHPDFSDGHGLELRGGEVAELGVQTARVVGG